VAAAWVRPALDRINLALLCFVTYAGVSVSWSPDLGSAGVHLVGILAFAMLFLLGRAWPDFGPAVALSVAVVFLFWAFWDETGYLGNPNFAAEYAVLALPFAWALRQGWLKRPLVGASLIIATLSDSRTGIFALWIAGVGWLWKRSPWMAAIVFMIPINLAVFGVVDVSGSLRARLELWINTAAMWADRPVLGTGIGGYDYIYPRFDSVHLTLFPSWGYYHPIETYAGAAHNEPLQLLAELGALGFLLALWLAFEVLRHGGWRGALAWALVLGGATCLIGFPLQNPCTLAVMALSLGAVAGKGPEWIGRTALCGRAVAVAIFAVATALMARTLEAQWAFQGVIAHFRDNPAAAVAANVRAYEIAPWDFRVRYQMYPMLAKASTQQNVVVKVSAFEKAWRISTSASPYSRYLRALRTASDGH
jgi:hypothetical protein